LQRFISCDSWALLLCVFQLLRVIWLRVATRTCNMLPQQAKSMRFIAVRHVAYGLCHMEFYCNS